MIGGYGVSNCRIEYWPKQPPVKNADKFDLLGPETDEYGIVTGDKDIPVAMLDNRTNRQLYHTNFKS